MVSPEAGLAAEGISAGIPRCRSLHYEYGLRSGCPRRESEECAGWSVRKTENTARSRWSSAMGMLQDCGVSQDLLHLLRK